MTICCAIRTIWVEAFNLDVAGDSESIVVTVPAGYGASVTRAVGTTLGTAYVGTVKKALGKITRYSGDLKVVDAATFGADAAAQSCAPGTHTATWTLAVKTLVKSFEVPVAVDRTGQRYKLTICLDAVRALGAQTSYVYFDTSAVFRNPVSAGRYVFSGIVTPFDAAGAQNAAGAYELRAYEDLPQLLDSVATYDDATKTLKVTGTLTAAGKARVGINVHIFTGLSKNGNAMKHVGSVETAKNGAYVFTKKLTVRPVYLYTGVNNYGFLSCPGTSAAPAGCASYSIDGRSSLIGKVTTAVPER